MKRNIFIWLVAMIILIVFSTLVFASGTINVKDYIKDKLPAIFSFYLSSLEDLDSYEKEFIDLLQNLPEEEEQKSFAKEVYNDGFSKEILEKIKREGVIAKTKTEIKGKKAEYRGTKFVYIDLPDGQLLKIEYGNDVVYGVMRIKDKYSFCEIGSEDIQEKEKEFHVEEAYAYENHLIKVHGEIVINNRLVKISGYNLRVEYTSLTPDIAIINESGGIEWKDKGLAKFKVSVFEHNSNIELGNSVVEVNVIKLPIITGYYGFSSVEEVIQKLGFPDRETEAYFEWYEESGYFEDIYYPFSSDSCGTFVQHWSYDKYPYLRIKNSTQVYTQGWDSLY